MPITKYPYLERYTVKISCYFDSILLDINRKEWSGDLRNLFGYVIC